MTITNYYESGRATSNFPQYAAVEVLVERSVRIIWLEANNLMVAVVLAEKSSQLP